MESWARSGRTHKGPFSSRKYEEKGPETRELLAADAVVVVVMADTAMVRVGMRGGDGKAENGQAKNGKQNLFHGIS